MTGGPGPDPAPSCPAGQTGTPPNCVTPGPTVQELFEMTQNANDAAEGAKMNADDAVMAAKDASEKLDVYSVMGDSMMAQMNAQSVLDNRDATNNAYNAAKMALEDLQGDDGQGGVKADAADHDNASLNSAIEDAIEVAEDAVKATKAHAEGDDLKGYVEEVTGTDMDDIQTPIDTQEDVAMAIGMALMPTSQTDGAGVRVVVATAAPTGDAAMGAVMKDDRNGMTWAEIVGAADIMEMRIAAGVAAGTTTRAVDAASIAGMSAASASSGNTPTMTDDGVDDGTEYADASYMGIPGVSFCAGSDCNVDSDGNLVGSWYFTPDTTAAGNEENEIYVRNADDTAYTVDLMYARYGHWLSVNATTDTNTDINVYALIGNSGTNTDGLDVTTVNTAADATTLTDTSATYSGEAVGMSFRKTFDSAGMVVDGSRQSGAFTADVELTANFGTTPTLSGTVDNFQSDNMYAVSDDWSVNLLQEAFTGAAIATGSEGTTSAGGAQGGEWTATGYGTSGERPAGIFGVFNAHFSDGHAAGAYATRKD